MKRLVLGLACVAFAARAQEAPVTTPTRDVDVIYRSVVGGEAIEQRSRFGAADGKLRLDTPSPGLYMIVDQRAHTMAMISDRDHGVVDTRAPENAVPGGVVPGQRFTLGAADKVAGLACTEWQMADRGQPVLCLTADGVLLRVRRGPTILVQATRVIYGPLDPATFTIPAGYKHVQRPERPP